MQGTVYMVRLGSDIMPHFRLYNEPYVVHEGVEVIFNISADEPPEDILRVLSEKALREAQRRGLEVNPRDFE